MAYLLLSVFFVKPKCKKGSPTQRSWQETKNKKPLNPSGRNNGSQVYEISKWALRKQMGSKEPGKREIVSSKPMGNV